MIGAVLVQRAIRTGADDFNRRDLEKMVKDYADDATYTFPGHLPIGGVHSGVTVARVESGKILSMKDYIFDTKTPKRRGETTRRVTTWTGTHSMHP